MMSVKFVSLEFPDSEAARLSLSGGAKGYARISLSNHALESLNMYRFLTSNISDSETTLNPNFS
jgi:hypothetical protein